MPQFQFLDIDAQRVSQDIGLLFPGWQDGDERVCVLSPHDDDAILGAGYAVMAAQSHGAEVFICIFCRGNAGYSHAGQKGTIEAIRAVETVNAYTLLGIRPENILRLGYSDFSMFQGLGWQLNNGREGSFKDFVQIARQRRITRLLVPNAYREHLDHWAVGMAGTYFAPQAGDSVLADWGTPFAIRSTLTYSTWGNFAPEDALVHARADGLRGNRLALVTRETENRVAEGILAYQSQMEIIKRLVESRKERQSADGWYVEVYLAFDPRPRLHYAPYLRLAEKLAGGQDEKRKGLHHEQA